MYSNCLFWALWKRATKGGKIISEPSKFGWWSHFLWVSDTGVVYEFVRDAKRRSINELPPILRTFPVHLILFKGSVRVRGWK